VKAGIWRLVSALVAVTLALSACGGGPTPTPTPMPKELRDRISRTLLAVGMITANAQTVQKSAVEGQANAGKDTSLLGPTAGLSLIETIVDGMITSADPPSVVATPWKKAMGLHSQVRDITKRWVDNAIPAGQVITEIAPLVPQTQSVYTETMTILSTTYHLSDDTLNDMMRQLLEGTPTPAPTK
jgi:hypothetical protein